MKMKSAKKIMATNIHALFVRDHGIKFMFYYPVVTLLYVNHVASGILNVRLVESQSNLGKKYFYMYENKKIKKNVKYVA